MKRERWILLGMLVLIGAGVLFGMNLGTRPFASLDAAQVVSASVRLSPPDVTVELDRAQIEKMVELLRQVRIYNPDQSYSEYVGQGVIFRLELADGTVRTAMAYNPFLVLDQVGYRTAYEPCQALNAFANRLLRGE